MKQRLTTLAFMSTVFAACDAPLGEVGDEASHAVPTASACAPREADLPTAEDLLAAGVDLGFAARAPDRGEVDGGRPFVDVPNDLAPAMPSRPTAPMLNAAIADRDGDCLSDAAETAAGTSPTNPDSDGDGWFDGACNERRKLVLVSIKAWDEQEDIGDDELYTIVDDRRFPTTSDLDGYWNFDDGQSRTLNVVVATRARGTATTAALATARVEGWEDDVEALNTWGADDYLWDARVDLGAAVPGQVVKYRRTGNSYDYEIALRVDVERFADPTPTANGDADGDGIKDAIEAQIARELGGIADPSRKDVLVELDWMTGHALETRARRLVTTRLASQGLTLQVRPNEQLAVDPCLTATEARALFDARFQSKRFRRGFRYAVMGEVLWNDASGVAVADTFFVDDSTWWISGGVLAQAGTFIHELGHTLGLTKDVFRLIDSIATPGYDSAMNYFWQPSKVDYSHDGAGGASNDHNDWAVASAAAGLRSTFGSWNVRDDGVCAK